ncbi:phage tail protein [Acinetobacter sp. ANC 5378]|uniref:phage tail protein n=1 Tax=Acinetobacter sp. ANC 5378 TaxID=2731249 RepID=UPI00148FDD1D|nr:phage tail protein [Acinetobacter sp. ANC 5378]NNG82837.1 hypothetical protein [Acinetobacter sp. ANC 5378]
MSDYYNILTNLGRSKITDLITSDTALENIQIAFGDGNGSVPTPDPTRTALVNEVHRRPANKLQKHPTLTNSIVVDVVIPNNVGGFWIREFGIYFDGVLICNGSLAPTFKEASDDTVNTYRLKPYINVESDRLKVVEIESDLINATESWTQENFINRSEIVDNLTTNDATKPVSAKQAKVLQDNKLGKTENAASATKLATARTIAISGAVTGTATSFDGSANVAITTTSLDATKLSGTASIATTGNAASATKLATARTIAISGAVTGTATGFDGSSNIAISTTEIDGSKISSGTVPVARLPAASTSAAGAVKLNNTLTSTSISEAATAAQVKVLNDKKLNNNAFGNGVNVTSSRISGATYTNPYDRPLIVVMSLGDTDDANFKLKIGDLVYTSPYDFPQTGMFAFTFVVPPNAEYMVKWAPGSWPIGLNFWWEF